MTTSSWRPYDYDARYRNLKRLGICVDCKTAPADHGVRCEDCYQLQRTRQRELYPERKAQGLCTACGRPVQPGGALCAACSDKRRKRYQEARLDNLCTVCGAPAELGKSRCPLHLEV